MFKALQLILVLFVTLALTGCTLFNSKEINTDSAPQWDFDHNVQFKQTKLANKYYRLEVIRNDDVSFDRLATFLLRKSYNLCGSYLYHIQMIQGIEGFDDKRAMPNYIHPSLIAKIKCN